MSRLPLFPKLIGMCLSLAAPLVAASPAVAHDTQAEAANRKVVLQFYRALNDADAANATKARIQRIAEKYLSPDYVQHGAAFADLPGPGSPRDKLIRMFQQMPPMLALSTPKTLSVMAEGDLVMMLTSRAMPDPASGKVKQAYIFNMFRVKNGQLVEHWDSLPASAMGGPGTPPPGMAVPGQAPPSGGDSSDGEP